MISYKMNIKVYNDKRHVGNIIDSPHGAGYQYKAKGSIFLGERYTTVEAVKKSLEE